MNPDAIRDLIEAGMIETQAIVDGDGRHFNAIVISPAFIGKNRVQKQQLVYATLGNRIADGSIHALTIKTFTPEEWQQQYQLES